MPSSLRKGPPRSKMSWGFTRCTGHWCCRLVLKPKFQQHACFRCCACCACSYTVWELLRVLVSCSQSSQRGDTTLVPFGCCILACEITHIPPRGTPPQGPGPHPRRTASGKAHPRCPLPSPSHRSPASLRRQEAPLVTHLYGLRSPLRGNTSTGPRSAPSADGMSIQDDPIVDCGWSGDEKPASKVCATTSRHPALLPLRCLK